MNLNSEEEDDTFYYEVEKILNMQEGDNKENWFFIKWKNYDESWYVFQHD
jgi:hypothetical protein